LLVQRDVPHMTRLNTREWLLTSDFHFGMLA